MARERYLLDDTEDTIHRNQIMPTTGSEKRQNWWFYHKTHVLVGLLVVAFAVGIIYSFVSKENPDYTITVMTEYLIPNDLQSDLQEHFESYGEDLNGDGKVIVALQCYRFAKDTSTDYEASELQASFVKFAADASAGDSMLFIYDDKSYAYLDQNDLEGFFGPVGNMEEDYCLWKDVPGLNTLKLNHYTEEGASIESVLKVLGELKVSIRTAEGTAFDKEEKVEYREHCIELFDRLLRDEPTQTAEN
ncbi:MAG: hypothetical protein ACI4GO_08365 [Hominenteromicrobium sp.]